MKKSGFLIAATSSGSGKTTLSLGLMRALSRKGLRVQPFKCGPDYIDTQFHAKATGNPSINLDTFMSSEPHVRELFSKYSSGKDIAVVEGVMGLFDGYSGMSGSSAELSMILSLPVILVINAASTAYSVAATIHGFKTFKPGVNIIGVIFNRVSSENHYSFLKEACKDAGAECIGYLKKDNDLQTPSRHLGLTLTAGKEMEEFIDKAADSVEKTVDIDKLLRLTELNVADISKPDFPPASNTLAMAYDEAFNFIYPENLERLRSKGFRIVKFSPIHDKRLPEADIVYFPGGYPELFAEELSDNESMLQSVRDYVEKGGKVLAECGGLIYLTRSIDDSPMCGVFNLHTTMKDAKLSLGYRTIDFGGNIFKGHEFHYSHIADSDSIPSVALQSNAKGKEVATPVYRYKNAIGTYTHLYWGDNDILKIWSDL